MARSQLPCPLFLLCSLLMLPMVLLEGPGGLSAISVTDEGVQNAAAFGLEKYNERSESSNYFKQLKIVDANSQVVSGIKYYITVQVGQTVCSKSNGPMPFSDIQKCELLPSDLQKKLTCKFEIWSRPWLNEIEVVSISCV